MAYVESGKWTCPDCHRTLTVYGSEPDCRASIRRVQVRHSRMHAAGHIPPVSAPHGAPNPQSGGSDTRRAVKGG